MNKALIQSIILITALVYHTNGFAQDPIDVKNTEINGGTGEIKEGNSTMKGQVDWNDRMKEKPARGNDSNKKMSSPGWKDREYIGMFAGYGGHIPVADYGERFTPSHLFSWALGIYALNLAGISPELHFRYTMMKRDHIQFRYDSTIVLMQFYPGLVYRHHFKMPWNTLTLYGRIWDGMSRIEYRSRNPYFMFLKERIVEYVNIFGLSAGCYYDIWQGILIGADISYSITFTAGKPLQSVAVTLNAGCRIL